VDLDSKNSIEDMQNMDLSQKNTKNCQINSCLEKIEPFSTKNSMEKVNFSIFEADIGVNE